MWAEDLATNLIEKLEHVGTIMLNYAMQNMGYYKMLLIIVTPNNVVHLLWIQINLNISDAVKFLGHKKTFRNWSMFHPMNLKVGSRRRRWTSNKEKVNYTKGSLNLSYSQEACSGSDTVRTAEKKW